MPLNEKGVKRVLKELKEYQNSEKKTFKLSYRENDLGVIYAVLDTLDGDYYGGQYILRIKLPDNYPYSPPVIACVTPNGRLQLDVNVCLSFSHFHPESWSPLITIEKMIYSILSVFYDKTIRGVGSEEILDSRTIKLLAKESVVYNQTHHRVVLENIIL